MWYSPYVSSLDLCLASPEINKKNTSNQCGHMFSYSEIQTHRITCFSVVRILNFFIFSLVILSNRNGMEYNFFFLTIKLKTLKIKVHSFAKYRRFKTLKNNIFSFMVCGKMWHFCYEITPVYRNNNTWKQHWLHLQLSPLLERN